MVDDTWRISVALLEKGADAENATKYWASRPGETGRIVWDHKSSEIFGAVSATEAAKLASRYVTASFIGNACVGCGEVPRPVVVTSRAAASALRTSQNGALCRACREAELAEQSRHRDRIGKWMASFTAPLPDELETLDEMLLLDKFTQSDPFKDRRLRGWLLERAGFAPDEVGQLLEMGILYPESVTKPGNLVFGSGSINYRPFEIDWSPAGEGSLTARFEAIEQLASQELHKAVDKFPHELETLAKNSIVWEAERYLRFQLRDRGIDDPTEAQLTRFRESVIEGWARYSLGEVYSAIWPGCAKAADNRARNPNMGRNSVTGSAVNAIVKTLEDFGSGQRRAKPYTQPYKLPFGSRTVSIFRIALDLDPLSALESDVVAALGVEAHPLPASEEILEKARKIHALCLQSMPEEHAFVATMVSLNLLVEYYDSETINAARAAFAGQRMASGLAIPDIG